MATTADFLLGESHRERSFAGYSPCGCKESDTNEATKRARRHPLFVTKSAVFYK